MKGKDLLTGMSFVDEKFIEEAGNGNIAGKKQGQSGRITLKKTLLIAAVISAMVLLMGCAVVLVWSAQDMKIAVGTVTDTYVGEDGEKVSEERTKEILTLHGIQDSEVYLAAQEWYEFTQNYDTDRTLYLAALENPPAIPEDYEAYSVYAQEMMDKVDEIAEKYDLNLLGTFAPFSKYESKVFYNALGIESLLASDSSARIKNESGYFYEGGNFSVSFVMYMPEEEGQWPYRMDNEIYYSKADNFDVVTLHIGNLEDWEQWSYTTKSGAEVLVMWHKDGGGSPRIFYNREDALIYVSIQAEYQSDDTVVYMTEEQLKQVIDQLDFSLVVENVDMDLAREKLQKFQNG